MHPLFYTMGLFSKKSATPVRVIDPRIFIPIDFGNDFLSSALGINDSKYLEYYLTIPELQAVVNYRAKCFGSMKVKLRKKDGADVEKHAILDLLNQPNILQSFSEFARQFSIYRDTAGNGFIYTLFGTSIEKTQALWNISPYGSEIEINKTAQLHKVTDYKEIIKAYKFLTDNKQIEVTPEEVIHFADNLVIDPKKLDLKGRSKLQPLTQTLENIKTAYESRGIILGNSPLGMITNDSTDAVGTVPLDPKEKKEVQDQMKGYGTSKGKYSYLISSAKLKWQSMSVSITEQHFKEVTEDMRTICNAFAFPPDLLLANSTYENIKEAKKQLYQDSIIPEANDWLSGLSSAFGLMESNLELHADFTHIAALQDDFEKKTRMWNVATMALNKALADQAITVEEYKATLEKIGMI